MAGGNKTFFGRIGSAFQDFIKKENDDSIIIRKGRGVEAGWPGSSSFGTARVIVPKYYDGERIWGRWVRSICI